MTNICKLRLRLKRCIARSRRRNGRCEFSTRLLSDRPHWAQSALEELCLERRLCPQSRHWKPIFWCTCSERQLRPAERTLTIRVVVQSQRMAALSPELTLVCSLITHPQRMADLSSFETFAATAQFGARAEGAGFAVVAVIGRTILSLPSKAEPADASFQSPNMRCCTGAGLRPNRGSGDVVTCSFATD